MYGALRRSSSTICTATALARTSLGNADHLGFAQDNRVSSHDAMIAAQPQQTPWSSFALRSDHRCTVRDSAAVP